jgi:predicted lactoylglutathione lyase
MSSGPPRGLHEDTTLKEDTVAASRKLFVNIAVSDLDRAVGFFTGLGFEFDPRFTDETATCMLIGEDAYAMLLVKDRFQDFTQKEIAGPSAQTEAILALSAESREEVDALVDRALATGGSPANEPMELGFMYGRSFQDPDGHQWEVFWMDPVAAEQGPEAVAAS